MYSGESDKFIHFCFNSSYYDSSPQGIYYITLKDKSIIRMRKDFKFFDSSKALNQVARSKILLSTQNLNDTQMRISLNNIIHIHHKRYDNNFYVSSKFEKLKIDLFGFQDASSAILTNLKYNICAIMNSEYWDSEAKLNIYYSNMLCINIII